MEEGYLATNSMVTLNINLDTLIPCGKCNDGFLLPIQDESQKSNVYVKGWICSACSHNVLFKNGDLVTLSIKNG